MRIFVCLIFVIVTSCKLQSQDSLLIAFYNVENLFDTIHDIGKNDFEFLPTGKFKWDSSAYFLKVNHIARVISALNNWKGADLVALAEVENKRVLFDLINTTSLKLMGYRFLHHESMDSRGIDVAILYKAGVLRIIDESTSKIEFVRGNRPTRDILKSRFANFQNDTISLFVNHWPSRMGGVSETEWKRVKASSILSATVKQSTGKAIVLGDFNDEIDNRSVSNLVEKSKLVRLEGAFKTLKYRSDWNTFDQIFVSDTTVASRSYLFNPAWLFQDDINFGGSKPYRFIEGKAIIGGYSDHLPVYCFWKF